MTLPVYEVVIDGKPRKIELTKKGEKAFAVKIDDKTVKAELMGDEPDLEKVFTLRIGEKTYRVELPKIDRDKPFPIRVDEVAFKAEVRIPQRQPSLTAFAPTPIVTPAKKAAATKEAVEGAITAPMMGKVLSVKVKKGDKVHAGQVVCVIEAMKMENEIAAPKAGTVREVNVSAGSSVNEGEALIVVD